MALSEAFNKSCSAEKKADAVIEVTSGAFIYRFDFIMRQQLCWELNCGYNTISSPVPFSQLDRELLETVRNKLIDLGGHPPELPGEWPPQPAKGGTLKL
jgi:hypothetical protein